MLGNHPRPDSAVLDTVLGPYRHLGTRMEWTPLTNAVLADGALRGDSALGRRLRACDAVLDIGAGDSFASIYGRKRFARICLAKQACLRAGTPLVLSPQTVGPFTTAPHRVAAGRLVRRARRVFARDLESYGLVRALGGQDVAELTSDVAFTLPYEPAGTHPGAPPTGRTPPGGTPADGRPARRLRVGVNVSGLLYNRGYTGRDEFRLRADHPALVDGVLRALVARDDVDVHLVAHVLGGSRAADDDRAVVERLHRAHPGTVLAPAFRSAPEAKAYLAGLDLLVGSRMHATIAAFSAGVPVVCWAYSPKFSGLFRSLGYDAVVDLRRVPADAATRLTLGALDDLDDLRRRAAWGADLARDRLAVYGTYLAELLTEVPGRPRPHAGSHGGGPPSGGGS